MMNCLAFTDSRWRVVEPWIGPDLTVYQVQGNRKVPGTCYSLFLDGRVSGPFLTLLTTATRDKMLCIGRVLR